MRRGNFSFEQTVAIILLGGLMTLILATYDDYYTGYVDEGASFTVRPETILATMVPPRQ